MQHFNRFWAQMMCTVIATVIAGWLGRPLSAQDENQFPEEYPETLLRTTHPLIFMSQAFRNVGCDKADASERAEIAWRTWRERDPDLKPTEGNDDDRYIERWRAIDVADQLNFVFDAAGGGLLGDTATLAERAWLALHGLAPDSIIPSKPVWVDGGTVRARYESNWLLTDERLWAAEPAIDSLAMLDFEIHSPGAFESLERQKDRDFQSIVETVELQDRVASVLAEQPSVARLWLDATNQQIHRTLYSRWPALDIEDEFDTALHEAATSPPADAALIEAITALRGLYLVERDTIEKRLIDASLEMGEMGCWYRPNLRDALAPRAQYAEAARHAVNRRNWYREQLQLLTQ